MDKQLKQVTVSKLPNCDICLPDIKVAQYDGATTLGPWAFMCVECFAHYGRGLGTGVGQKLVVGK